jgi:hypothetical protein
MLAFSNYLLITIITFLGIPTGMIVSYFAEEELEPGLKYFKAMKYALYAIILLLSLLSFFSKSHSWLAAVIVAGMILLLSLHKEREVLLYVGLAAILSLSWIYGGLAIIAPLIFLYGFPLGSIYLWKNKRKGWKTLVTGSLAKHSGFLVLGIFLGITGAFL